MKEKNIKQAATQDISRVLSPKSVAVVGASKPAFKSPLTLMVRLANALAPAASVTRTVKLFVPASLTPGVPERVPLAATASHAGPAALL